MKILKFKTNIKSEEEIAQVASFLDQEPSIKNWEIDTNSEENILSISGENPNPQQVVNGIQQTGFTIEVLRILGIGGESL